MTRGGKKPPSPPAAPTTPVTEPTRSGRHEAGDQCEHGAMYVVLVAAIVAGLVATVLGVGAVGEEHNYRDTVSPWFRSLFALRPDIDAMAAAPLPFQLHTLIGMLLFALWPFTRLVHAFTAPVGYLFRPYIVYRPRSVGAPPRRPSRGWEGPGS